MFLLAILGILGAIGWLLTARRPVVNLNVMGDRNFSLGVMMIAFMAFILYSSAVVIPQFAEQVIGYNATLSGLILSPGGVVVIMLIPLVSRVLPLMPTRYLISFGFTAMGFSLLYSSRLVPNMTMEHMALIRMSQTVGLAFMFVPISTIAYSSLPRELNGDAAALYTMFRNVFGSIGISTATALITSRTQTREAYLSRWLTPLNQNYNALLQHDQATLVSMGHAASTTHDTAVGLVYQTLRMQSSVLAYSDVFSICAVAAFAVVPFTFLFSNYRPGGGVRPNAGH
jgi:DHA2 family multidrug resistance protein